MLLVSSRSRKVTSLKIGQLELISGDSLGYVSIFWLETGETIHQCKIHEGSIIDVAFDSTKLVTCGMDCCLKVIDITTCQILHTLRDFEKPVVSLGFDYGGITTLSHDGFLKYWLWEKNLSESGCSNQGDGYLYHTVGDSETIPSICRFYDITLADLIKLNDKGAIDNDNIRAGVKIRIGTNEIKKEKNDGQLDNHGRREDKETYPHIRNHHASLYSAIHDPNMKEAKNLETALSHDIKCEPTSLASRLNKQ